MSELSLYSDGGLIGVNPSPTGGTWAYLIRSEEGEVDRCCGVLRPVDIDPSIKPPVSNNITELYALVTGVLACWPYEGPVKDMDEPRPIALCRSLHIFTDSQVSLFRVRNRSPRFTNVPEWLIAKTHLARAHLTRFASWDITLLQGHPTAAELRNGWGEKRSLPVSVHNVTVDRMCTEAGKEYLKENWRENYADKKEADKP